MDGEGVAVDHMICCLLTGAVCRLPPGGVANDDRHFTFRQKGSINMERCLRKGQQPRAEKCQEEGNTYRFGLCKRKCHAGGEWGRLHIPNLSKNEGLQTFFPTSQGCDGFTARMQGKCKENGQERYTPNA